MAQEKIIDDPEMIAAYVKTAREIYRFDDGLDAIEMTIRRSSSHASAAPESGDGRRRKLRSKFARSSSPSPAPSGRRRPNRGAVWLPVDEETDRIARSGLLCAAVAQHEGNASRGLRRGGFQLDDAHEKPRASRAASAGHARTLEVNGIPVRAVLSIASS